MLSYQIIRKSRLNLFCNKIILMNNNGSPRNNKTKETKQEQHQKGINNENKNSSGSLQTTSLVKYDTPFLVSTTISNKKTLEELDENNENAEKFLRNLMNKRGGEVSFFFYY